MSEEKHIVNWKRACRFWYVFLWKFFLSLFVLIIFVYLITPLLIKAGLGKHLDLIIIPFVVFGISLFSIVIIRSQLQKYVESLFEENQEDSKNKKEA